MSHLSQTSSLRASDSPLSGRVVDLSVTLSEKLPCFWPGHMPFAHNDWNWFTETDLPTGGSCCSVGPYHTCFMVVDEHSGTHLDGPTHFIPPSDSDLPWAGPLGAVSSDQLDLGRLIGPAAVVDMRRLTGTEGPGVSPTITAVQLREWEDANGAFQPGEVVLLWTDWTRHYVQGPDGRKFVHEPFVTRTAPGWPAPDAEAAIHLHERGVVTVGIDAPSMGSAHDGARVHQEGLSRGMLFIEMLTNLDALPARGTTFVFLPIKVAGATGGPGRAIAFVPPAG
jgi:kynurenine formamidase